MDENGQSNKVFDKRLTAHFTSWHLSVDARSDRVVDHAVQASPSRSLSHGDISARLVNVVIEHTSCERDQSASKCRIKMKTLTLVPIMRLAECGSVKSQENT